MEKNKHTIANDHKGLYHRAKALLGTYDRVRSANKLFGGSNMVQLVAVHSDGKKTVINTTQDVQFLDKIVEDRDGTMWIGSELCDLRVQVVK